MTTVTLSISETDRQATSQAIQDFLSRRKQLVPWPFSIEDTERLYIPEYALSSFDRVKQHFPDIKDFFHASHDQSIVMDDVLKEEYVIIRMHSKGRIKTTRVSDPIKAIRTKAYYPAIHKWASEAIKIEKSNIYALQAYRDIMRYATTFKQVHKLAPEFLPAVAAQQAAQKRSAWGYRNAHAKMQKVCAALRNEDNKRARGLGVEATENYDKHKKMIRAIVAQASLLPCHDGLLDGSNFDYTWVTTRMRR